ncbi:unnamed protein product [Citrullus colocynthis]|uniref:Uncharacterized protein n=1 Tax=Citrullus colocynthis TaxID=252529 RepID=A0ABP0YWQ3_9ROSI
MLIRHVVKERKKNPSTSILSPKLSLFNLSSPLPSTHRKKLSIFGIFFPTRNRYFFEFIALIRHYSSFTFFSPCFLSHGWAMIRKREARVGFEFENPVRFSSEKSDR